MKIKDIKVGEEYATNVRLPYSADKAVVLEVGGWSRKFGDYGPMMPYSGGKLHLVGVLRHDRQWAPSAITSRDIVMTWEEYTASSEKRLAERAEERDRQKAVIAKLAEAHGILSDAGYPPADNFTDGMIRFNDPDVVLGLAQFVQRVTEMLRTRDAATVPKEND